MNKIARPRSVAAISNISHALTDQRVAEGKPFPLGAACTAGGVNFRVYSKNATGVELLLFDHVDDAHPSYSIPLDPSTHQSWKQWFFTRILACRPLHTSRPYKVNDKRYRTCLECRARRR